MFTTPISRYRPSRTSDGEGGVTETLASPVTLYVTIVEHQNKQVAIVEANEDVIVGDILDVDGAQYRVTASSMVPGTQRRRLDLERVERPITP